MMTMNSNKKTAITKKEFRQMFTRSCTLDSAWNYERQQHINYCYMMIPVLKRLYGDDKEAMAKALNRHLEFMSCTPHLVSFLAVLLLLWKRKMLIIQNLMKHLSVLLKHH